MIYNVVWFKRDLRLYDHAALYHAAQQGSVLCLYVIEPEVWANPDAANQHYQFILESLRELYSALKQRGGSLYLVTGEVPAVLDRLHQLMPFSGLYSHEETGNGITFERDKTVARWCRAHGVIWHEFMQFGVVRGLQNRNHWNDRWDAHVNTDCLPLPSLSFAQLPWQEPTPPSAEQLGLSLIDPPQRQRGGRRRGLEVLQSFLTERSSTYRGGISSPLSAPTACSRLSPYLTYGCLSLREIVAATKLVEHQLGAEEKRSKQGLAAFISRLYWHCHFIQKLESEPALEYHNLHRGYDNMREMDFNPVHFEALCNGRTGWPMVDACVAMLRETGWINFRMRAMLVSVAAYPLWLHWRPVGHWLAQQFLDYEPGIHWSQMQMQSGTTGINIPRIYNPIKQARDHDPYGHFVRRWLPAMRRVPDSWLFEPWRMPPNVQANCAVLVGRDIALPLIDLDAATREAKVRLFARRAQPEVIEAKPAIIEKHSSRKPTTGKKIRNRETSASKQISLEF